ncbi:hypothetical protein [Tautonia rosea]|uniref:hypothetical protein n=1 Tax=Tautonia rosea TaxID=2728037 RepID=UPI001474BFEE|nr:hypothetical protein [Tautonia rosea]
MAEEYAAVNQSIIGFDAGSADPLTDLLRQGARTLLAQAIEAEVVKRTVFIDGIREKPAA